MTGKSASEQRQERLARQLRENLKRRKVQARKRRQPAGQDEQERRR
jgi:hypothetical protein